MGLRIRKLRPSAFKALSEWHLTRPDCVVDTLLLSSFVDASLLWFDGFLYYRALNSFYFCDVFLLWTFAQWLISEIFCTQN